MIIYVEFEDDENQYIAAGFDPLGLPVYEITGERRLEKTRMLYPSCLKFLPGADVGKPSTATREEWRARFDLHLSVFEV